MDSQARQKISEKILLEINKTEEDIAKLEELIKPIAPDDAIGRLTRMEAISAKSVNEAAHRNAKEKLAKLKYAKANIDKPGFGTCRECGNPIPIARILLMPESTMCVPCAEEYG